MRQSLVALIVLSQLLLPMRALALSIELTPPAKAPAGEPRLFQLANGDVALSWVEELADGTAELKFARLEGRSWTSARTVASGNDWFVNWADTPGVISFADGVLLGHYLKDLNDEKYAYEIRTTLSYDEGKSWSESDRLHDDESATEHGFLSWAPVGRDRAWAVWLDGRQFVASTDTYGNAVPRREEMTLRAALVASDGAVLRRDLLDMRVCDCCPTDIAASGDYAATVYRDRSDQEIRDTSVRIFDGTRWSDAITLGQDNWKVAACPVNGPSIALDGADAAVAWFSAADNEPQVNFVLGSLESRNFGQALRIDHRKALGRVQVAWADGKAWVLWMEEESGEIATLKLRSVSRDGTLGAIESVASCSSERSSGFPQLAASEGGLVVIWNTGGDNPRIRGLLVPIKNEP